jgi:SSS family solute:Na+ symporter
MFDVLFTAATCLAFMAFVALVSYWKTRGEVADSKGYFLAGRGLTGLFIAGSLLLTNLSAEHLIGLNGNGYRANMSGMAWEVTAAVAIVIMAMYLLPRYLGGAFTTLPEFLASRYDSGVRTLAVLLFLAGYVLVTIPATLYCGALAVLQVFDIPSLFDITSERAVWILVWVVGAVGAAYAIFGGLKAVAVSDTLNGIGLLIIGMVVPLLALSALGQGDLWAGVQHVATTHSHKLNAIGGPGDSVPFGTIFTGMIYANLFYWGTNQYVIQRTLAAKDLREGQKGVLFSGFFKLAVPLIMMVPGVLAFHLYGPHLQPVDLAYPRLVNGVLPTAFSGLFLAVLLGAVFSTFNSLLNSAATMFTLDVYQPRASRELSDAELIRISKLFGLVVAVLSFFVSPLLMYASDGIFDVIRKFTGFFNIPLIAVVAVGLLAPRVSAKAAKVAIVFHLVTYYLLAWGVNDLWGREVITVNFIHLYFFLFWGEVGMMLLLSRLWPHTAQAAPPVPALNLTPWRWAPVTTVILVAAVLGLYLVFSPVGLAYAEGVVSPLFLPLVTLLALVSVVAAYVAHTKLYFWYEAYLARQYGQKGATMAPMTKVDEPVGRPPSLSRISSVP